MLPNPIPGLTRGADPTLPRQVLAARLKVIDKRRAEIEVQLNHSQDDDYRSQELKAERQTLGDMRSEIQRVINPPPKARRSPELRALYAQQRDADLEFLRVTIKQQTEQTEWAAQKEEAAGNHRQARILRLTIPEIPEQVCKEFGKNPTLLAEIDL
jgi:hypothetical protein